MKKPPVIQWITSQTTDDDLKNNVKRASFLKKHQFALQLATGKQVHQTHIEIIPTLHVAREFPDCDGFLTDVPHQTVGIFTADCFPIFLSCPAAGVVGVLHAGWRGVQQKILGKAVRMIGERWKVRPKQISVWIGPGIRSCCFKVQWDVARVFPQARLKRQGGWQVDLPKALENQAKRLGVVWQKTTHDCTHHDMRFFSYRRDQTAKRLLSVIMKTHP